MGIGSKIKEILDFKGIKQKKFAEMINETTVNVNRYINEQRQIPNSLLPTIAKELNISIDELLDGEITERKVSLVPVIGTASCGGTEINCLQDENKKAYYNGDFWKQSLYCVIANGDSMSPEIDDGDEVIIDPDVPCQHGDMVYYKIDGESAIKVLAIDKEAHIMQFVPYNSSETFKTKTIRLDDEETIERLTYHKVVSVNKLKFNNRAARLKLIGR
ncbi:LexA family transcriptional regulator [Arcobacter cryaerophilus gv. pseudocryaerophilus]|uniref:LexA family transcriptional regulator n=3 Tax=unclassified Arcobacter TaxID=2593671 RepID=A0AA96L2P5_9BACT|nr:LexA family transcriptional regulator [Arcobacter sp. AZ-2023]WPD04835.1 LexA family transcriptional regulator [Arcobacter sp. DSM 115956]WPD06930.1 LexA family transcriptional regulator [Arcobacter sp. DSM 115955]WNL31195.1 LexA family transcriptional regulator [Arcobacter sp. AZ-2023]WNP37345.1 LexA family transcriptional regulator [Arcobacter sp. AZ-2023]